MYLVAKWKSLYSVHKKFQNILIISENFIHKFEMKMNPVPSSKLIWSHKIIIVKKSYTINILFASVILLTALCYM